MNLALKAALIGMFGTQCDASQALRIDAPRLSRIIRGRVTPTAKERLAVAQVFGTKRAELLLKSKNEQVQVPK